MVDIVFMNTCIIQSINARRSPAFYSLTKVHVHIGACMYVDTHGCDSTGMCGMFDAKQIAS